MTYRAQRLFYRVLQSPEVLGRPAKGRADFLGGQWAGLQECPPTIHLVQRGPFASILYIAVNLRFLLGKKFPKSIRTCKALFIWSFALRHRNL